MFKSQTLTLSLLILSSVFALNAHAYDDNRELCLKDAYARYDRLTKELNEKTQEEKNSCRFLEGLMRQECVKAANDFHKDTLNRLDEQLNAKEESCSRWP